MIDRYPRKRGNLHFGTPVLDVKDVLGVFGTSSVRKEGAKGKETEAETRGTETHGAWEDGEDGRRTTGPDRDGPGESRGRGDVES